jgi:hypothetical protein
MLRIALVRTVEDDASNRAFDREADAGVGAGVERQDTR